MTRDSDITEHDRKVAWRCPRLGDTVPFRYCRTLGGDLPCPTILSCWQERFDIAAFLKAHYDTGELQELFRRERPPKTVELLELIRRAGKP